MKESQLIAINFVSWYVAQTGRMPHVCKIYNYYLISGLKICDTAYFVVKVLLKTLPR